MKNRWILLNYFLKVFEGVMVENSVLDEILFGIPEEEEEAPAILTDLRARFETLEEVDDDITSK